MAGRLYLNGNPIKGGGRGTGTVPCFILFKCKLRGMVCEFEQDREGY